jgi:predicted regulator of Ras-like GTPase activity (Roadblock/LC7/MglB family)
MPNMATLPQLIEDDMQRLNEALREMNTSADATASLIIDKGGFLITHQGNEGDFDLTTIAALSSGAFMANQTIAGLVNEPNFNSIYQQGEKVSLFVLNIDEHCMLVVIFKSQTGVGVVKYFASPAAKRIACQLAIASERTPGQGLDLSVLNVPDAEEFFRRKEEV